MCGDSQGGYDCRAGQTLFVKKTGQPFLTVVVRLAADGSRPEMLIRAPLRTYLPAGISLSFSEGSAQTLPFRNCNRSGCVAVFVLPEDAIASLSSGTDFKVSIRNPQQQPITLTVPAADFASAYAKMKR
jgi:invasion protein IalB